MQTLYKVRDNTLVLDNGDRKYVLKIKDLPPEEKPREKLLQHGPGALSNPELLAVVLNTGTKREEVLVMATRVLEEYGDKSFGSHKDPEVLATNLDIPKIKAAQIVACAELGRRFFKKNEGRTATIRTAKDVFTYAKDMRELTKEHLRGVYLNAHHKVIHDEIISIGTVNANLIHPREVFQPAFVYAAVAVVLIHNHPSGSTKPSVADIEVTKQLVDAGRILGIDLIDHVIITKQRFASIPVEYQ